MANNNVIILNDKRKSKSKTFKIEEKIKGADFLIFNDVCAVALKYDASIEPAPFLLYKSKKIELSKTAANNLSIPIYKNNIAANISLTMKKNDIIPVSMYTPIAEILAQAYKGYKERFDNLLNDAIFYTYFKSKLNVEIGGYIEKESLAKFMEKVRQNIISELGLIIPIIRIGMNQNLENNKYLIKINDNIIADGKIYPDKIMDNLCFSNEEIISKHVEKIIKENAAELFSRRNVYQLLQKLDIRMEGYSDEILSKISIGKIQVVLTNLLKEQIPIKEIESIFETLSSYNGKDVSTDELTNRVRQALSITICAKNSSLNRELHAVRLSKTLEKTLTDCINKKDGTFDLDTKIANKIFSSLKKEFKKANEENSIQPVLLCKKSIRPTFKKFIEISYPNISVLSTNEINKNYKLKCVGIISI